MFKTWILLLALFPLCLISQTTHPAEWFQIENSEISILGTSNVTDYHCILHDLDNNSDLQIKSTTNGLYINLESAIIQLKSNGFSCDNNPMTKEFCKTIKADKHPYVFIEFLSFKLNHPVKEKSLQNDVIATIAVNLAGVRKVYALTLESLQFAMDSITIKGLKEINMSDFQIEAPSALFGLVQANDQVTIDFRIVFNLK